MHRFMQQFAILIYDRPGIYRMITTYQNVKRALAQGLVEYGLIIAFVALLAVGSLLLFRPALPSLLSTLAGSV